VDDSEQPSDGLFIVECEGCKSVFPAENGKCFCGLIKGKLLLDIDKMLDRVYNLHASDKDDAALDVVFDVFWQLHAKFDIMNNILSKVDLTKIDESIMVGFMVQTFKYSKQVPEHTAFCNKVAARMKEIGRSDEDIHDIVDNYVDAGDYWESMKTLGAPEWLTGPKPE